MQRTNVLESSSGATGTNVVSSDCANAQSKKSVAVNNTTNPRRATKKAGMTVLNILINEVRTPLACLLIVSIVVKILKIIHIVVPDCRRIGLPSNCYQRVRLSLYTGRYRNLKD